jgi:hypothetical protein
MCRDFIRFNIAHFDVIRLGRQWGKGYELDICGVNEANQLTLVGECKWSDKKVGLSVLENLKNTLVQNNLPLAHNPTFCLFSKSGFTDDLTNEAKLHSQNLILIDKLFQKSFARHNTTQ